MTEMPGKSQTPVTRQPASNRSATAMFIAAGAAKRRKLAYTKAKMLQRELGVVAPLVQVK
ncbi:MAG: hypothetical protein VKJ06_06865 [Vampirovibrionales bacterium]|nr:hypothetical protein [Vampirovibrionales bacterium]